MRAVAEAGNRTIYAMRQEEKEVSPTPSESREGGRVRRVLLGNGKLGNSFQADSQTSPVSTPKHSSVLEEDEKGFSRPGMPRNGKGQNCSTFEGVGLGSGPNKESSVSCSSRKRLINGEEEVKN